MFAFPSWQASVFAAAPGVLWLWEAGLLLASCVDRVVNSLTPCFSVDRTGAANPFAGVSSISQDPSPVEWGLRAACSFKPILREKRSATAEGKGTAQRFCFGGGDPGLPLFCFQSRAGGHRFCRVNTGSFLFDSFFFSPGNSSLPPRL